MSVNRTGMKYGKITTRFKRGPRKGKVRTEYAHRVSLKVFRGRRLTTRMVGSHMCNYSLCIHPMHLTGGSQGANVRKCVRDGRHRNGASG